MAAARINELLNDKLFQVIGSTPESVAESLSKMELRNKSVEGGQIFAIAIFAATVNKPTLETFLADARFSTVRPLLNAALSIQGRSNMTAITLLGHCFLTTDLAAGVDYATEFRKKMGQDHLWDGSLEGGSLSDKQRGIMKEKKRVTSAESAKALGTGFLKWTGLVAGSMTVKEAELFNMQAAGTSSSTAVTSRPRYESVSPPVTPPRTTARNVTFEISNKNLVEVPAAILDYRRSMLQQTDEEIAESIERSGVAEFISKTERLIAKDPTGARTRGASVAAGGSRT